MNKQWNAKWIGIPGVCLLDCRRSTMPSPEFRRAFIPEQTVRNAEVFLCGLGYFEWSINGEKITEDVLVPSPTQYDRRWRYLRYVLPFPLEKGKKYVFSVTLGNGLYNCQTHETAWHFDRADWRDYQKMIFQLEDHGKVLLISDQHWITASTGTRFDSLRGGEICDARLNKPFSMELPEAVSVPRVEKWVRDSSPDEQWHYAWVVPPPGGIGEEQTFPGCREIARNPMREIAPDLWKSPVNGSGVPVLRVRGKAGSSVRMICGERLSEDALHVDNRQISGMVPPEEHFQEDTYILNGDGEEEYSPRFTFHGFQFIETFREGDVQILSLEQKILHTGFPRHGSIRTGEEKLQNLEQCAMRANVSNFCGYPTDCPHREKNGWTSESMLMCEALLYAYDASGAYEGYVETILDTQRPSGQISATAPCAGWGYNWGSGGHWDYALFDIPWSIYLFTGKDACLRKAYDGMKKNLCFQEAAAEDGLSTSLGDWLAPDTLSYWPSQEKVTDPVCCCATAFRIASVRRTLQAAKVLGKTEDVPDLEQSLRTIRKRYNEAFYLGNGIYRGVHSTFSAMPLNLEIVPEEDRKKCAEHLLQTLRERDWKVDYGTIGSRQVPRALFENGYADAAFRLMTQEEFPGYQNMLRDGRTTLTEDWNTDLSSLNHGAFSDIAACMYRYLAGFRHSETHPGAEYLEIVPVTPEGLQDFSAEYRSWRSSWKKENGKTRFQFHVPENARAHVRLPDGTEQDLTGGDHGFCC